MGKYENYVGVFDSGVGGVSVLQELEKELPHENFYYFGDSAHTPYGEKPVETIRQYSMDIADNMVKEGCKAIVIACNTATSAAAPLIREKYDTDIPILGIEPAIKPAAEQFPNGHILVMATPATLQLEKYHRLSEQLAGKAEFIPVMCAGLATRVEKGNLDSPDVVDFLRPLIGPFKGMVDGVVLGCTHYPFVKNAVREIMGDDVVLFDGGAGTARQLRRRLTAHNLLNDQEGPGDIILDSSLKDAKTMAVYEELYHTPLYD